MDSSFESPHITDISIVPEDGNPMNVKEVLDYHEDIDTYLREMEIKCKPKGAPGWLCQWSVKCPIWAQVIILQFISSRPA